MNSPEPFIIAGESIAPGTMRDVAFPITTMATGTASSLAVRVLNGARPGPAVFVSAAIHGDEIIGTAVIQRLAKKLDPVVLAGTVMLVPVANIFGFITHSRYLPDRRDLNRSFPGSAGGSLAGQLANIFYREVVARCPGHIQRVTRAVGDAVTEGDVLATIESNDSLQSYAVRAPMYQAMASLGLAAESSFTGTPQLGAAPPGASVLVLGAGGAWQA